MRRAFSRRAGVGLGVATVLILAAMFWLFRALQSREARRVDVRVPAMVAAIGEERVAELPDAEVVEATVHNYVVP